MDEDSKPMIFMIVLMLIVVALMVVVIANKERVTRMLYSGALDKCDKLCGSHNWSDSQNDTMESRVCYCRDQSGALWTFQI
jgi:hypothetical protein